MKPTTGYTKRAWIRDANVPAGQPATGRISCPCGNAPPSLYDQRENVHCACGILYDGRGYILSVPASD